MPLPIGAPLRARTRREAASARACPQLIGQRTHVFCGANKLASPRNAFALAAAAANQDEGSSQRSSTKKPQEAARNWICSQPPALSRLGHLFFLRGGSSCRRRRRLTSEQVSRRTQVRGSARKSAAAAGLLRGRVAEQAARPHLNATPPPALLCDQSDQRALQRAV